MITLELQPEYFLMVQAGKKKVEGRLKKPKLETLRVGSIIIFKDRGEPNKQVHVQVVSLNNYPTFRKMLENEGVENCLPGLDDMDQAVSLYHSLPGYLEGESLFGVLGIGISLTF